MYKIWFKFNSYTGNFEREFVAYMFGYEDEYSEGDYKEYIEDFYKNGKNLVSFRDKLKFTYQEVDDSYEETFYNIDPYMNKDKECNSIFVQLDCKPTKMEYSALIDRAKTFPKFLEKTENMSHLKGINLIDMCLSKESKTQDKIM